MEPAGANARNTVTTPDKTPPRAPAVRGPSRLPPWVPLFVLAAAWLAHGSALGADWIGDDAALVRDHPVVTRGPASLEDVFAEDAWPGSDETHRVWRPLTLLSLAIEAPVWGADDGEVDPFGFHLTNLFLHGLASLLLLLLAWRLAPFRPALVAATAALFAVHPLHASTVASLGGRADLLCLVLALLAAWLWIESGRGRPALLPLAALSFFLALLAKEAALGLPVVLVALDAGGALPGVKRTGAGRALAYGALGVPVLLWARHLPGAGPDLLAGVEGLGRATIGFFVPVGWVRDGGALTSGALGVSWTAVVVGGLVLVGGLATLLGRLGRGGPVTLALALTGILWSVATLVAPAGAPLEPRFAYVTGVGLFVVGGALLRILLLLPAARPTGTVAAFVLLACLTGLCWREGRAWSDADAFHRALVDRYPANDALLVRGARRLRVQAERARTRAMGRSLSRDERKTLVRETTGWLEEARTWALTAMRRADPLDTASEASADAHRELGFVLQDLARPADAIWVLREALRLEPWLQDEERNRTMPQSRRRIVAGTLLRLGRAEESVGESRQAAIHTEHAAELQPGDLVIQHAAGRSLMRAGEHARALRRLRRVMDQATDPALVAQVQRDYEAALSAAQRAADRHLRDARAAIEESDYRAAIAAYEQAIEADPTLVRAYHELAFHVGQWFGSYPRAYELIETAERMMRETGHRPEDAWWQRFKDLRVQLAALEAKDREEEGSEGAGDGGEGEGGEGEGDGGD